MLTKFYVNGIESTTKHKFIESNGNSYVIFSRLLSYANCVLCVLILMSQISNVSYKLKMSMESIYIHLNLDSFNETKIKKTKTQISSASAMHTNVSIQHGTRWRLTHWKCRSITQNDVIRMEMLSDPMTQYLQNISYSIISCSVINTGLCTLMLMMRLILKWIFFVMHLKKMAQICAQWTLNIKYLFPFDRLAFIWSFE